MMMMVVVISEYDIMELQLNSLAERGNPAISRGEQETKLTNTILYASRGLTKPDKHT